MDWIFQDDNARTFIQMLANGSNPIALKMKPVKMFIELMWSEFQPAIIRYVFAPYCIYLAFIYQLTGSMLGKFLNSSVQRTEYFKAHQLPHKDYQNYFDLNQTEQMKLNHEHGLSTGHGKLELLLLDHYYLKMQAFILTGASLMLMIFFGWIELRQLFESGYQYFFDVWNIIDMISLMLNYVFMSMFFICIYYNVEYFDKKRIQDIGSWAIFFMWIKVFYWFRLFPQYAYYVKLITQTISDSRDFSFLVLIIMIAFGNFLYVANRTNDGVYEPVDPNDPNGASK